MPSVPWPGQVIAPKASGLAVISKAVTKSDAINLRVFMYEGVMQLGDLSLAKSPTNRKGFPADWAARALLHFCYNCSEDAIRFRVDAHVQIAFVLAFQNAGHLEVDFQRLARRDV